MSRSALKDVLLDLKKQMRSKRASSYGNKKDENKPKARPDNDVEDNEMDIPPGDDPKMASKKPEKVDFSDEIKKFMKNKRTAKVDEGTAEGFGGMMVRSPIKKKGKA